MYKLLKFLSVFSQICFQAGNYLINRINFMVIFGHLANQTWDLSAMRERKLLKEKAAKRSLRSGTNRVVAEGGNQETTGMVFFGIQ